MFSRGNAGDLCIHLLQQAAFTHLLILVFVAKFSIVFLGWIRAWMKLLSFKIMWGFWHFKMIFFKKIIINSDVENYCGFNCILVS